MDKLQRVMNWLKNINLAKSVEIIFDKYEGDAVNIDNADDAAVCRDAIRAFEYIQPWMLDFGPKSKKYVINLGASKIWSKSKGIRIAKDELLPKTVKAFHPRIVKQDATVFMNDWWNQLLDTDTKTACRYSSAFCHQAFKVNNTRSHLLSNCQILF